MNFLPKEKVNNPNALEEILIEMNRAYELEKVPMTEKQSFHTAQILISSEDDINKTYDNLSKHWQFAGFFKRCEVLHIKYEKRLLVWVALMTYEFGIGGMILVAYYMQFWAAKLYAPIKNTSSLPLTLDEVMEECFPFGIFSKETVHEFWDKQKVAARPDNLIDHPIAARSFMPIDRTEPITHKDHIFQQ